MEKYIDLPRVIIKNSNIDNNPEFDDIIKYIINKILMNIIIIGIKVHIVLIIFIKI